MAVNAQGKGNALLPQVSQESPTTNLQQPQTSAKADLGKAFVDAGIQLGTSYLANRFNLGSSGQQAMTQALSKMSQKNSENSRQDIQEIQRIVKNDAKRTNLQKVNEGNVLQAQAKTTNQDAKLARMEKSAHDQLAKKTAQQQMAKGKATGFPTGPAGAVMRAYAMSAMGAMPQSASGQAGLLGPDGKPLQPTLNNSAQASTGKAPGQSQGKPATMAGKNLQQAKVAKTAKPASQSPAKAAKAGKAGKAATTATPGKAASALPTQAKSTAKPGQQQGVTANQSTPPNSGKPATAQASGTTPSQGGVEGKPISSHENPNLAQEADANSETLRGSDALDQDGAATSSLTGEEYAVRDKKDDFGDSSGGGSKDEGSDEEDAGFEPHGEIPDLPAGGFLLTDDIIQNVEHFFDEFMDSSDSTHEGNGERSETSSQKPSSSHSNTPRVSGTRFGSDSHAEQSGPDFNAIAAELQEGSKTVRNNLLQVPTKDPDKISALKEEGTAIANQLMSDAATAETHRRKKGSNLAPTSKARSSGGVSEEAFVSMITDLKNEIKEMRQDQVAIAKFLEHDSKGKGKLNTKIDLMFADYARKNKYLEQQLAVLEMEGLAFGIRSQAEHNHRYEGLHTEVARMNQGFNQVKSGDRDSQNDGVLQPKEAIAMAQNFKPTVIKTPHEAKEKGEDFPADFFDMNSRTA